MWRRCIEFKWPPQGPHPPSSFTCSSAQKLSEHSTIGIFMETALCMHDWLNHWLLVVSSTSSPPFLPGRGGWGGGWEVPPLRSQGWVPWQLVPSYGNLGVLQKSPYWHKFRRGGKGLVMGEKKDILFIFISLEPSQDPKDKRSNIKQKMFPCFYHLGNYNAFRSCVPRRSNICV